MPPRPVTDQHQRVSAALESLVARFATMVRAVGLRHPNATDAAVDYSVEPRTLVTFTLEDSPDGGTLRRVVESGFDALPAARREPAFLGNSKGWRGQLQKRLPAYLASA